MLRLYRAIQQTSSRMSLRVNLSFSFLKLKEGHIEDHGHADVDVLCAFYRAATRHSSPKDLRDKKTP